MIIASLAGSAALIIASFLALGWIRQAEQCRSLVVGFAALCMAQLSLWIGVIAKWHIFAALMPHALLRVHVEHPWLRISNDATDIFVAAALYLIVAAAKEYQVFDAIAARIGDPNYFVRPADRPRRHRVSPFEQP